jgi:hypothetical protein
MISKLFSDKLTPAEIKKVQQVCKNLNIQANWLLAVMYFESARTLSPSILNNIGSVGLIQFTRDKAGLNYKTISGKRYLLSDLAKMTFIQQMDVVELYYKEVYRMMKVSKLNSFIDVYLVTFFPVALNKPNDYVLETKYLTRSKIASQNPLFDRNKDGKITKSEIVSYFASLTMFKKIFEAEINISKPKTNVLPLLLIFFYSFLAIVA